MVLKWIYHAAYSAAQSEKHVHRNHTLESDVDSMRYPAHRSIRADSIQGGAVESKRAISYSESSSSSAHIFSPAPNSKEEHMQQSHYLVKATAALSIEGAAAGAALAADAMGEDISVAPHNSNSPLPLLPPPRHRRHSRI